MFFDDFRVEHVKSPVVQMDDYYPFGLTFNSYQRENSLVNNFKFQGQEHINDLNLGWDAFKWRNHQPEIGRFFNIDPIAEKYYYNSPYAFSENKVIAHVELEGLETASVNPFGTTNSLHVMSKGMGSYFRAIGSAIDDLGAKVEAFLSFGTEEEGEVEAVKGNIANETRATATIGTTVEEFFTPTQDNKPIAPAPFVIELKVTNENKTTISGKATVEGVDIHMKNVTSQNTETGEVKNTTTITVGKDQTGVFIEGGTDGTKGGIRTEQKVSEGGFFIKFGGSLSVGSQNQSQANQ